MISIENNAARHFIDRHPVEGRGSRIAFIDAAGAHSYSALAQNVNRAGNLLRAMGVERGARVLICLEDRVEFAALFFGALKIGAVPVPINTMLTRGEYDYLLRDAQPRVLAVSESVLERFEPIAGTLDPSRVLVAGSTGGDYANLATALADASDELDPVAVDRDETGFLLYSSGSTGRPKGVRHRHCDLIHTAQLYGTRVLGICAQDVIFSASKMFFAYGLGNSCSFTLHAGATAILLSGRPEPASILALLSRHRVTVFFGFPTLYGAILAAIDNARPEPLQHLRLCVSAGEALPSALALRWSAIFGLEILDGIGSTEALHIFISNRPDDVKRGTSGKPVAGYEISLRDDNGRPAAAGEIADLWCRGPSIMPGYWRNQTASQRALVDGWLRTGDKYLRDAEGYYHYCGRSDDMLKVGGVWVSPHEVEAALLAHPTVLEAAVVGHLDTDDLMKPKAFVVLKDPAAASPEFAEHLQQFVKQRIAPYKYPRWVEFRTDLPKTATGKIRRALLRKPV